MEVIETVVNEVLVVVIEPAVEAVQEIEIEVAQGVAAQEVVEVLKAAAQVAAVAIKEKEEMIVEAAMEIEAEEEMIAPVTQELAETEAANAQVILLLLVISLNLAENVVENLSQIQVVQVVEEEERINFFINNYILQKVCWSSTCKPFFIVFGLEMFYVFFSL